MDADAQLEWMLEHLEWANRRALEAAREADNEKARRLLSHLRAAERVWLRRLEAGDSSGLEIWPELSFKGCADLLSGNVAACRQRLRTTSPEALERPVTYRNSDGREFHTPLSEILLHVLLHGSYHRGQIAMRLRDSGDEPVNTDFPTFVRERPRGRG